MGRIVRQVTRNRVIQGKLALLCKQHSGRRRELFRHRPYAKQIVGLQRDISFDIRQTIGLAKQHMSALGDDYRRARAMLIEMRREYAVKGGGGELALQSPGFLREGGA